MRIRLRVSLIVRELAALGSRTLMLTSVPSSPRRRSTTSRSSMPLVSTPSTSSSTESFLISARAAGPPSMIVVERRPLLLLVPAQGDEDADVAVARDLLGGIALLDGHQLGLAGHGGEQALEQGPLELRGGGGLGGRPGPDLREESRELLGRRDRRDTTAQGRRGRHAGRPVERLDPRRGSSAAARADRCGSPARHR